jgi:hypothetical protein
MWVNLYHLGIADFKSPCIVGQAATVYHKGLGISAQKMQSSGSRTTSMATKVNASSLLLYININVVSLMPLYNHI